MKMKLLSIAILFVVVGSIAMSVEAQLPVKKSSTEKNKQFRPYKLSKEERKDGFKILFDGTSMSQWTSPNTKDYILEDGCIVMKPSRKIGGNLYSVGQYDNFVLRFEFMLTPAANNGLGLRHKMVTTPKGYDGMELQILDDKAPVYKDLKTYQYHGSVYTLIPAKRGFLKPLGEWNCQEVTADSDHIRVVLNGEVIVDGYLSEAAKNHSEGTVSPSVFYKTGHIAFLGHGDVVKFRNIRIKKLH
ncbi:MAG: DUF1080 domain-containing protein [Prolixibacteraceae bacterium]|jgi:hypothetical protein|nr:DUF1080 domain-containing protein [Prolixibacteraceae bacterium]